MPRKIPLFLALLGTLAAVPPAAGSNWRLAEEELALSNRSPVEFESVSGPNLTRNDEDLIVNVGGRLTRIMLLSGSAGDDAYALRRVVPEGGKLGADLFLLGSNSEVNHVVNVQRLLMGYLRETWGWDHERTRAVAWAALVYNAAKRNDRPFFAARYVSNLLSTVPEGKLGIDRSYRQWPGKTTIVLPVSDGIWKGLPVSELTAVAQDLLKGDPSLSNVRAALADARRDQITQRVAALDAEQATIDRLQADIARRKAQLDAEREAATNARQVAAVSNATVALAKDQAALNARQTRADRETVSTFEEQASLRQEKKEIISNASPIANPSGPANGDTGAIASPKGAGTQPAGQTATGELIFLKTLGIEKDGYYRQQLILIDPLLDTVRPLRLDGITGVNAGALGEDPVLVVRGEGEGEKGLVLARVDRRTLKIAARGKESIFHATKIWVRGDKVYAVSGAPGRTTLCRFDKEMALEAKSDSLVFPDTQLIFAEGKIYCTLLQGDQTSHVLVLGEKDLARKTSIR